VIEPTLTAADPNICPSCGLATVPGTIECVTCTNVAQGVAPERDWMGAIEGVLMLGIVGMLLVTALLLIFGTMAVPELQILSGFATVLNQLRGQ
jgi:hypothetical protein